MKAGRAALLLPFLLGHWASAQAEPYLAAREGFKCMQCHVNPTGGGMRNAFGNVYAQALMPSEGGPVQDASAWAGALGVLSMGGDLRASASLTKVPNQKTQNAFEPQQLRIYVLADVVPNRLAVYADQQMTPGSGNREAYARLWLGEGRYYLKAGQMYLPYGLRLQDDTAFIRTAPGISFTTPDNGVEVGLETAAWTAQLAVSNGSSGGSETNRGKQVSLRAEYVQPAWRAGTSFNHNDADAATRRMQNAFVGLKTGAIVWLGEADYIVDKSALGQRGLFVSLLEANWTFRKGHNVKLSGEYLDPNDEVGEDEQVRYSLVWEYTPIPFLQVRVGVRESDASSGNALENRRLGFFELHGFF